MLSVETMSKRVEPPGADGWVRSAQQGDPDKYLIVTTDYHTNDVPTRRQAQPDTAAS